MSTASTSFYLTDFIGGKDIKPTDIYCTEHQVQSADFDYTVLTFHLGTNEVKIFAHDPETLRQLLLCLTIAIHDRKVIEDKPVPQTNVPVVEGAIVDVPEPERHADDLFDNLGTSSQLNGGL